MAPDPIPDDIRRFILTSIPSVPHLEAALLLRGRVQPSWDPLEVAGRLYMAEKAAGDLLSDLRAAGILSAAGNPPAYAYAPASEELRAMIDRLADAYAKNLIGVSDLIHSKTGRKAQIFADAFKWRKDS